MDINGEYRIDAPREHVWLALNDPEVLRRCIPGCETLEQTSDTGFALKAKVKIGPVSARFAGKVTLTDLDPPNGYTLSGEGQGGAAGFGKGIARVALTPESDSITILTYTAEAQVGGKLAQLGSRLIRGTARKMADDFFDKFHEILGVPVKSLNQPETADEAATELLVETAEEVEAAPEVPSSGVPGLASVPLVTRPDSVAQVDEETAPVLNELAEPHHRLDDETAEPAPASEPAAEPVAPEPVATEPVAVTESPAPTAVDAAPREPAPTPQASPDAPFGLRPAVWVPLLLLVLLVLVMLV
ncbi:SRPBCC family protein [Rhodocista pekingensis]|uniref:SRPBCC domain-containing protein n=1 Tax=Rhodocista pekingensis TaxID=201185 RepID=A0ABW2KPV9_9PROT